MDFVSKLELLAEKIYVCLTKFQDTEVAVNERRKIYLIS